MAYELAHCMTQCEEILVEINATEDVDRELQLMEESALMFQNIYIPLKTVRLFFPGCVARVPVSLWGSGG